MLPANFKPERTAAVSRGFLETARLSCYEMYVHVACGRRQIGVRQRMWYGNHRHHTEDVSAQYGHP